jgi:hypothetical protein
VRIVKTWVDGSGLFYKLRRGKERLTGTDGELMENRTTMRRFVAMAASLPCEDIARAGTGGLNSGRGHLG